MLFGVLHKLAIGFAVVSVVSRPVLEAGVVEWSSLVNCALWAEPFVALEGEPKQGKDVTLGCGGSFARFAYWIIGLFSNHTKSGHMDLSFSNHQQKTVNVPYSCDFV